MNNLTIIGRMAGLPPQEFADASDSLREWISSQPTSEEDTRALQSDCVTHHCIDNLYTRELFIPRDTLILSRVHLEGSINVIAKGKVIIYDTNGRHEVEAPYTFCSPHGTHRAVYALEDTVWNTIHVTDGQDPSELFDRLTVDKYAEYLEYRRGLEHGMGSDSSNGS